LESRSGPALHELDVRNRPDHVKLQVLLANLILKRSDLFLEGTNNILEAPR
jgi:hypothetical protein